MEPEDTVIEPQIEDEPLLEDEPVEDDVEALKQKLADAEEAKRQLTARAKKAEDEAKKLRPKVTKKDETPDEDLWDIADMIQKGYTRSDAEFITNNGGFEALKDPNSYASIALKGIMEQRQAERAASQTSINQGMSEVERKYTPEQLANMSASELEKILPHTEE